MNQDERNINKNVDDRREDPAADEELMKLFGDFKPDLPSDDEFMSTLRHNLHAIDAVKRYNIERKAINRKALALATVTGFLFGLISSLFLPYLSGAIENIDFGIALDSASRMLSDGSTIISIALLGLTTILVSLNVYELVLRTHPLSLRR